MAELYFNMEINMYLLPRNFNFGDKSVLSEKGDFFLMVSILWCNLICLNSNCEFSITYAYR